MVWVIEGHLQSRDDDELNTPPIPTAHYLRPDRKYRLGRLPFAANPAKPNVMGRKGLHDFRIKFAKIPRSYGFELTTGPWGEARVLDQPDSDDNLTPYSLTFTSNKKGISYTRHGSEERPIMAEGDSIELHHLDTVHYSSTELSFVVRWEPYVLCLSGSIKQAHIDHAASLGIKLASKIFLPHHTHFLVSKLSPTGSLCIAALRLATIVNLTFLSEFHLRQMLDNPPPGLPNPPGPGESLTPAQEGVILALNVDAGADWCRYWGHAPLEVDWEGRKPREEEFKASAVADFPGFTSERWDPNPGRDGLFKDILFVSFRGSNDAADKSDSTTVRAGQGHYVTSDLLNEGASSQAILHAIDGIRASENVGPDARLVIVPPDGHGVSPEPDDPPTASILREVATTLGVYQYLTPTHLLQAIFDADASLLFADEPPASMLLAPPTAVQDAGLSSAPGASFNTIGGTHPEESTLVPPQQGRAPAPAPPAADAAPPARKLTRRARTAAPSSALDDLFGAPRTQPADTVPELSLDKETADTAMNVDHAGPTSSLLDSQESSAPTRRLKRRVGVTQPAQEESASPEPANVDKPTKRTRRPVGSDEENDSGRLPALLEEAEPHAGASRRKRDASVLEDVPAAPSKRTRAASRQPEEDHSAAHTQAKGEPKKKELVKEAPVPPTPPRGKAAKAKAKELQKEKEQQEKAEEARLLLLKPTKRKGKEAEQEMTEEFNALRIVRPALTKMPPPKSVRIGWDDETEQESRDRLIREDEERREHPDRWGGEGNGESGMFQVQRVSMVRKDRPAHRNDVELEEKYAGRPNFKRFRPKNSQDPAIPREQRPVVKLVISGDVADFGLGPAYAPEPKPLKKKKVRAQDDMDDDATQTQGGTQMKLNFASKPKAKAKSKAKEQVIIISDDDDDEDDDVAPKPDAMDVDSDELTPTLASGSSKSTAASKSKAKSGVKTKTAPAKATRRAAPTMLIDEDSDDSDGGLTFKGFAGTKRKR